MKIYSIKLKSKRNPNVFVVDTNRGEFDFHSDIIVKFKVQTGEMEDNDFFLAEQESANVIAFNLATKYISSKLKTEQQIKDYLYKKEFHKSTVENVVEKLKEYKIIDDENYAKSYAKSNPNFSRNKLKQKLFASGVMKAIVEENIKDVDDFNSCLHNAEKYLKNKIITKEVVDKLIRRLQTMGYTWDIIKSTLNYLKCEIEE